MKIKTKLLIFLLILILIPTFLLLGKTVYDFRKNILNEISINFYNSANSLKNKIDDFLNERKKNIDSISNLEFILEHVINDKDEDLALYKILAKYIKDYDSFDELLCLKEAEDEETEKKDIFIFSSSNPKRKNIKLDTIFSNLYRKKGESFTISDNFGFSKSNKLLINHKDFRGVYLKLGSYFQGEDESNCAIVALIKWEKLNRFINNIEIDKKKQTKEKFIFVTDSNNNLIFAPKFFQKEYELYKDLSKSIAKTSKKELYSYRDIFNKRYIISNLENKQLGWNIFIAQDYSTIANKNIKIIKEISMYLIIYIILIIVTATYLISKIFKYIDSNFIDTLVEFSKGNFTKEIRVDRKDEIGKIQSAFYETKVKLSRLVSEIQNSSNAINEISVTLSNDISDISHNIELLVRNINSVSSGADNQKNSTENTIESLSSMLNSLHDITNNANRLKEFTSNVDESISDGNFAIKSASSSIQDIESKTEDLNFVINNLFKKINEISTVIKTIDDISNKTNLLSLNASIEASRAGVHGKGFAVVANEIKSLSKTTSDNTSHISEIITEILNDANIAKSSMEDTKIVVNDGVSYNGNVNDSFQEITNQMDKTNIAINGIVDSINIQKDTSSDILQVSEELKFMSEKIQTDIKSQVYSSEKIEDLILHISNKIDNKVSVDDAEKDLISEVEKLNTLIKEFKL